MYMLFVFLSPMNYLFFLCQITYFILFCHKFHFDKIKKKSNAQLCTTDDYLSFQICTSSF